jgi:SAM-dependent methyltransferase
MPQAYVTQAVMRALRRLPAYPQLEVLDLSCGSGEILSLLHADGVAAQGTHFREGDYILYGLPTQVDPKFIRGGTDLTRPLPFADASFDVVLLTEVIEHLETFVPVLREAGRVLRSGGHLVLSTPNVHRMQSRWKFLWTGTHKLIGRRAGWDTGADQLYELHTNPADFPFLHALLHQSGLSVERIDVTRIKWRYAWWMLTWPVVALLTTLEIRRLNHDGQRAAGESDPLAPHDRGVGAADADGATTELALDPERGLTTRKWDTASR